eukprot:5551743-Heterocapsa_arctica.AAC.1
MAAGLPSVGWPAEVRQRKRGGMNWGGLQAGTSRDVVLRAFRLGRGSPGARPLGRVAEQSADRAETGWPAQ